MDTHPTGAAYSDLDIQLDRLVAWLVVIDHLMKDTVVERLAASGTNSHSATVEAIDG